MESYVSNPHLIKLIFDFKSNPSIDHFFILLDKLLLKGKVKIDDSFSLRCGMIECECIEHYNLITYFYNNPPFIKELLKRNADPTSSIKNITTIGLLLTKFYHIDHDDDVQLLLLKETIMLLFDASANLV